MNKLEKMIKGYISDGIKRAINNQTLIEKVAQFCVCEMIPGDYVEFGVYRGDSFIHAYKSFEKAYNRRVQLKIGGENSTEDSQLRTKIWEKMRFFAFDSFEGLPELESSDAGTEDFKKGMYASTEDVFNNNCKNAGLDEKKVTSIKGWFNQTCNSNTAKKYDIEAVSVAYIDGDLYSSARDSLNFITPYLQDGTVIIFDDWYSYKGHPRKGEQKAFHEWIESKNVKSNFVFNEYQKEDWKRTSFIASRINEL